jgi:hypothetical protein
MASILSRATFGQVTWTQGAGKQYDKVSLAGKPAASLSLKGVLMKRPGKIYDVVDDRGTRILTSFGFCSPGLREWYKKNGWTIKRYDFYQGKQRNEHHKIQTRPQVEVGGKGRL